MGRLRGSLGDVSGAVADLGVFVPLVAALVAVNGLDAGAILVAAGLLVLGSGVAFRIPFPVQPLKALTAVAVAHKLGPHVIHAAGLEMAAFLLLLSMRGTADAIARFFTTPVVRAVQLGVGVLLVFTAVRLVLQPPGVFRGTPRTPWPALLALAAFIGLATAARRRRYGVALALLVVGVGAAWISVRPDLSAPSFTLPSLGVPPLTAFGDAFLLLVVPQLPLTFGNAVVAVTDVARGYFGPAASRVTPARVCVSSGAGNVFSALIGGMPMCHGAGGLTAHARLGARSARMNLVLGTTFLALGIFLAGQVPLLLGLLPVWVLAAFLAYAGLRHAWLVSDLRGRPLALALVAGGAGAVTGNLAVAVAIALVGDHASRLTARRRSSARERVSRDGARV